jgi:GT2 family glycosyltransferase
VGDPSQIVAHVDTLVAVDATGFWISGWTSDVDGLLDRLAVVSPEGQRVELDHVARWRRPDVEEAYAGTRRTGERHGFGSFFELAEPSRREQGWRLELRDARGARVEAEVPAVVRDPVDAKERLLAEFCAERADREELRVRHLLPALSRLQERERSDVEIDIVREYGEGDASPTLSIVVPLYRRIDYLEHQLLHFSQDPSLRGADLIYVLDTPELWDRLLLIAPPLHALHGIPFRVARLTRNAGYATANNLGVSLARGRLLLLLNSDVIPDQPGWLEKMATFYDATPGIGALGPKLLFEDDSIQHAGMYFARDPQGLWGNLHYAKGVVHRDFPPASVTRPVPAVTGACLMVARALFDEAGGLSHLHMRGGYEDSDFCLRLVSLKRTNWYLPEAELYHLEGQSHHRTSTAATVIYATWLQTHLWDELIEDLMQDHQAEPVPR